MKQFLLILGFFSVFFSCTNSQKTIEIEAFELSEKAANLYQIVGEKHDTAMLLMKDIAKVQSRLRRLIEKNARSKAIEEQCLEKLTPLAKADKAMMDWMSQFKSTVLHEDFYKNATEEEILDYLKEEEIKIEQVHQTMLKSIAEGGNLVAELQ